MNWNPSKPQAPEVVLNAIDEAVSAGNGSPDWSGLLYELRRRRAQREVGEASQPKPKFMSPFRNNIRTGGLK